MRAEDAAAVAELSGQLGYASTPEEIRRRCEVLNRRSDARVLVAEGAGSAVVGWVHVQVLHFVESPPRAEIEGLVVAENARGGGIGRQLVEAAEEWAKALGLDTIGVRSNHLRAGARKFYERLGYNITKTQHVYRKAIN